MQDRYAGDVGDYGKIGLLKCLQSHGFTIGINWYRVSALEAEKKADGTYKHYDGRHLIPKKIRECDPELAEKLTKIANGKRTVTALQRAASIPNAVYYDDYLTVYGRDEWHDRAMKRFKDVNLVFMDPDNGLLVKSVGKGSSRSVKYALYEEVKKVIGEGKSVLVYNHRSRKPEKEYFEDIERKLAEIVDIDRNKILEITFSKGTTRDYFAIPACEKDYEIFRAAFTYMDESVWGKLGVCRYREHI